MQVAYVKCILEQVRSRTPRHYQSIIKHSLKKRTTWKIDVNNLSVRSLQGLLLVFINKRDDFANKNEEFDNPITKKKFGNN